MTEHLSTILRLRMVREEPADDSFADAMGGLYRLEAEGWAIPIVAQHVPQTVALTILALLDVAEAARDFAICTTVLELSAAAEGEYLLDDSACGYCDGCKLQAALDLLPQQYPKEEQ